MLDSECLIHEFRLCVPLTHGNGARAIGIGVVLSYLDFQHTVLITARRPHDLRGDPVVIGSGGERSVRFSDQCDSKVAAFLFSRNFLWFEDQLVRLDDHSHFFIVDRH